MQSGPWLPGGQRPESRIIPGIGHPADDTAPTEADHRHMKSRQAETDTAFHAEIVPTPMTYRLVGLRTTVLTGDEHHG